MSHSDEELDRRVKAAVEQALLEERRQAAARRANDAHNLDRRKRDAELLALEKQPRTWGALALRRFRNAFALTLVALLVGLVMPIQLGLGALGLSPAGSILCPLQCQGCSGPGKTFTWRYRGSWKSNKGTMGSAHLCNHPSLDAEHMTWVDVSSRRNDALQPYLLSGFAKYPVDALSIAAIAALLYGLLGTTKSLRQNEARRRELSKD